MRTGGGGECGDGRRRGMWGQEGEGNVEEVNYNHAQKLCTCIYVFSDSTIVLWSMS